MRTRLGILVVTLWLCALLPLHARAAQERARIVLVDSAREARELKAVIAELLERDGVTPEFTGAEHFEAEALLAAPDADARVHVYVSLPTPELARLYLRGPLGQRFLLRDLPLRAGLDELGCESIAQVVASSTQALLHSSAGLDRETAQAELVPASALAPAPAAAPPAPQPLPEANPAPASRLQYALAARGSAAYSGAALRARWGGGAELSLIELLARSQLRQRLVFEQYAAQELDSDELRAQVRYSALRLGLDFGAARGANTLLGGLAAGVDLVSIDPEEALDPSWSLSHKHIDVLPMLRAELRYERHFGALVLSVGAYADVVLGDNQFKLQDGSNTLTLARPWHVLPGLALGLGFHPQ